VHGYVSVSRHQAKSFCQVSLIRLALAGLILLPREREEGREIDNANIRGLTLLAFRRISSPRTSGQYKVHPLASSVMGFQLPPVHQPRECFVNICSRPNKESVRRARNGDKE